MYFYSSKVNYLSFSALLSVKKIKISKKKIIIFTIFFAIKCVHFENVHFNQ